MPGVTEFPTAPIYSIARTSEKVRTISTISRCSDLVKKCKQRKNEDG